MSIFATKFGCGGWIRSEVRYSVHVYIYLVTKRRLLHVKDQHFTKHCPIVMESRHVWKPAKAIFAQKAIIAE